MLNNEGIWSVQAPAKLNLFFEVLGRRDDGYHDIVSLAVPVSLYDTLTFEPTNDELLTFFCEGDATGIPQDDRNIVVRAVELLCRRIGRQYGAKITLTKRIPVQAGLGGGSSDAAAVLKTANEAWQLGLSREWLRSLSAEVGSDCPIFFESGPSVSRGRGEIIEPFRSLPKMFFVIVKPDEGLSTASVYAECMKYSDGRLHFLEKELQSLSGASSLADWGRFFFNRLETPAAAIWEGFFATRRLFDGLNCHAVQMSGSGTAFFALCDHPGHAEKVAEVIRRKKPGMTVLLAQSISDGEDFSNGPFKE